MIDIVVTSYFRPQFTWNCLDAIKTNTLTPHRVILIDNGSDKETKDMLMKAVEFGYINKMLMLPKNIGLEPAKNIGLSFVQSDWFCDMDNDIVVPPAWLESLLKLKDKHPEYAAIACHPQVFVGDDINFLLNDKNEIREYSKCGASARLMNTKLVREAGGWRNEGDMVTLTRGEEFYICGKLRAKGYKVGYAREIGVKHLFGKENWGYENNIEHYHKPVWPMPSDKIYS
ncbi:MAG: glycosyltransferase [Patescibacteria group bacterium]